MWVLTDNLSEEDEVNRLLNKLKAGEALQSSVPALEQLASALSHDVRTPLRHINHFLDFFEKSMPGEIPEEAKEHLDDVKAGVENAAEMIETLVAYARLDVTSDAQEIISLPDLLLDAMSMTKTSLDMPEASLSVLGAGRVEGVRQNLSSLFMYLFENALSFYRGEDNPQVRVVIAELNADLLSILVEDNGEGLIGSEVGAFRMFQKGRDIANGQGLGTGLAFARRIAELHGGHLFYTPKASTLGGAAFTVILPAAT